MITNEDRKNIKRYIKEEKTGKEIAVLIHKRYQTVLDEIRNIKNVPKKTDTEIYTPKKFLTIDEKKEIEIKIKRLRKKRKKKDKITKAKKEKIVKKKADKTAKRKKKITTCKFNYETVNHKGYKFITPVTIRLHGDENGETHLSNLNYIKNKIEKMSLSVRCKQRQNYATIAYKMFFEGRQNEYSSRNTHISYNLTKVLKEINSIYDDLIQMVSYSGSPTTILIYQIEFINYDFKSKVI